jgi:hypothetical protein
MAPRGQAEAVTSRFHLAESSVSSIEGLSLVARRIGQTAGAEPERLIETLLVISFHPIPCETGSRGLATSNSLIQFRPE